MAHELSAFAARFILAEKKRILAASHPPAVPKLAPPAAVGEDGLPVTAIPPPLKHTAADQPEACEYNRALCACLGDLFKHVEQFRHGIEGVQH
jgi:hypothetical protein